MQSTMETQKNTKKLLLFTVLKIVITMVEKMEQSR